MLFAELTRLASHCVWLGTHGIDLGAISTFFYCFDLRENILDLSEDAGGARMHPNYFASAASTAICRPAFSANSTP